MTPQVEFLLYAAVGALFVPLLGLAFKAFTVEVEDEEARIVTRWGKLAEVLTKPGLHFLPDHMAPWVNAHRVSLRRDFREFTNLHVNDARGTTVIVDVWVEVRITDPVKARFAVVDWEGSMNSLVIQAVTAILGNREFHEILHDRVELANILRDAIALETDRWGVSVDIARLKNVSLLPDVSQQVFDAVSARLERAKAEIEEYGHVKVARVEAEADRSVAELTARAKGQYPEAVGRALAELAKVPQVHAAYNELYSLSLVRPHRTVAFRGFGEDEIRSIEAAMLLPPAATEKRLD